MNLLDTLRQAASAEGFVLCGVAPAIESTGFSELVRWIEAGYAGQMQYLADRQDAYRHPSGVLDGAKSVIALAYPYDAGSHRELIPGSGKIARYVWSGVDYHDIIHPKLKRLCQVLRESGPTTKARGVIDTAPLMEREIAQLAGLGWQGKNTLLLNRHLGSYYFLACVLTDIELPPSVPHESTHCGTCTACLDACPTDAFPQPGVLDATRCISYLTIEHRGPIELDLREKIGDWVFGCDVCQEVCPWNRKPSRQASCSDKALDTVDLRALFTMTDEEFRDRFRRTPLWRTRRRGILRNAAIVLGNQKSLESIPALQCGLKDPESLVRGAAAWGLGRIGGPAAIAALGNRLVHEDDCQVRQEISMALKRN